MFLGVLCRNVLRRAVSPNTGIHAAQKALAPIRQITQVYSVWLVHFAIRRWHRKLLEAEKAPEVAEAPVSQIASFVLSVSEGGGYAYG